MPGRGSRQTHRAAKKLGWTSSEAHHAGPAQQVQTFGPHLTRNRSHWRAWSKTAIPGLVLERSLWPYRVEGIRWGQNWKQGDQLALGKSSKQDMMRAGKPGETEVDQFERYLGSSIGTAWWWTGCGRWRWRRLGTLAVGGTIVQGMGHWKRSRFTRGRRWVNFCIYLIGSACGTPKCKCPRSRMILTNTPMKKGEYSY